MYEKMCEVENTNHSPLPKITNGPIKAEVITRLDFNGAILAILDGKRVTRAEWKDKRTYFVLKDDLLQIHKAGESEELLHPLILNNGDLGGLDYYVC
jgi:hypothetical protein